jgi:hypothetical protein
MPIPCSAIKISGSSVLATAVLGSSVSVPACSGQSGHRSNFPLLLRRTIDADHYPLSPRIRVLQSILDRIEPPPVREPLPALNS